MATIGGYNMVTDGLVLSLDAGNINSYTSGSAIWNDLSGNRNSGSLVNGPIFNTSNIGSIVFDGINDYVLTVKNAFKNNFNINWQTAWTIDSWVNMSSGRLLTTWYGAYNGGSPSTYATPKLYFQGNNLLIFEPFLVYRRTFGITLNFGNILQTTSGTWANLVSTFNGTTITLYINGRNVGSTSWQSSLLPSAGTTNFIDDEFRIMGVNKIVVDSADKIYVGGSFTKYNNTDQNFIVKLNADATKDTSFNVGNGADNEIFTIELLPSGKLNLAGAFSTYSGSLTRRLVRVNSNGTTDGFNLTGGSDLVINGIKTNSTGSTYIAGIWQSIINGVDRWALARISSSVYDSSFDVTQPSIPTVNSDRYYYSLDLDSEENLYAVGSATTWKNAISNRIIKLDKFGNIMSSSFNTGTGFNNYARVIKIDSNGKILVGGDFTSYSGSVANRIVRLNTDGTIDTTFNSGTGFNNTVREITIESTGKILVGGNFTTYSGSYWGRIVRLNSNGTVDNTFISSSGFDQMVNTIAVDSLKNIYIGGNFYNYSGSYCNAIVKLNSSGSIDTGFNSGTGFNRRTERDATSDILIGADGVISDQYFSGSMATYKMYSRALSDSEILQNYNATKGRFGL